MKAGNTNYEVGTRIQITHSTETELIGTEGTITHPFPGLMQEAFLDKDEKYTVGVYLENAHHIYIDNKCNLTNKDKFIILE